MKFPHYIFNPFHGMTAHDRLADLLRYRIEKRLPSMIVRVPQSNAPYIYRTMVCAGNLELGLVSLASLAACAKSWPRIEMCVDKSISAVDVQSFYAKHGISVHVWTAQDLLERLDLHGEFLLKRFAETYFWGRKTAFTFGTHETLPILYSDLDVLWFKDPWIELKISDLTTLLAAVDRYYSYDQDYLAMISEEHRELLLNSSPYCAGVYALPPGFRLPEEVLNYIQQSLDTKKPKSYYEVNCSIEQTSLGLATNLVGSGIPWQLFPTCPEAAVLSPKWHHRNRLGAHYATPVRRQLWRDAWAILKNKA